MQKTASISLAVSSVPDPLPHTTYRSGWHVRTRQWFARRALLRHNMIFLTGSLAVGFLNYLYYPVLGRLMAPSAFGEVQVLASLLAQIIIFLNVFGLVAVHIVANDHGSDRRNRLLMELERLALGCSVVLIVVTCIAGPLLRQFLHFGSAWAFIVLAVAVMATVPLTFRSAFLRGRRRFMQAATVGAVGAAADLVLAAGFVRLGLGTLGAMIGLVCGQTIAFGVAAYYARRAGLHSQTHGAWLRLPDRQLLLPELPYAGLVLACSLGMTLLYSLDAVVVKHYFDARTAGLYAGIATIARIVFFVTASVVQVLLPSVRVRQSPAENRQVLLKSCALLLCLGGVVAVSFAVRPDLIIRLLMGAAYAPYAALLPWLGAALLLVSLVNLFVMYHLALRRYWTAIPVGIGLTAWMAAIVLHHASPRAVVDDLLFAAGVQLVTILVLPLMRGRRQLQQGVA